MSKKQDQEFAALFAAAKAKANAAFHAHVPVPMRVVQRANPLDDSSPVVRDYGEVAGGVCGFAWVKIRPGNSSFARWLRKNKLARPSYYGGIEVGSAALMPVSQSMEKNEAGCRAAAEVFKAAGIEAYADSRMD